MNEQPSVVGKSIPKRIFQNEKCNLWQCCISTVWYDTINHFGMSVSIPHRVSYTTNLVSIWSWSDNLKKFFPRKVLKFVWKNLKPKTVRREGREGGVCSENKGRDVLVGSVETSLGVITETLSKIKTTDPFRLVKQTECRYRNWWDSSDFSEKGTRSQQQGCHEDDGLHRISDES
jgi:hypothetical protein